MSLRLNLFAIILLFQVHAQAILHGQDVASNDPLRQVAVKITATERASETDCTGTRISRNFIITAGHCLEESNFVLLGDNSSHRIAHRWAHPKWDNDSDEFDVALLEMEEPIAEGPIAVLPKENEEIPLGQELTVAGFGNTETGMDGRLHKTTYRVHRHFLSTQISFSGQDTGICGGDSGGGNFIHSGDQFKVVAISSSTVDEDDYGCDSSGYLIRLSKVRSWIDRIIKKPAAF